MSTTKRHQPRNRKIDAFLGFLLGLGAPMGWLCLRLLYTQKNILSVWMLSEFAQHRVIYAYMTIGTITVFSLFGYFLGRLNDTLIDESDTVKEALNKVHEMAMTDALTSIHNARYLHDHLSLEMESAKRYGTPLAGLMLDIDNFKGINDTHGHPYGDLVLIALSKTILQCVRSVDIVGRLGGEEFLIIMPHTSFEKAFSVAERIRKAVEEWPFTVHEIKIPVTVSIGVTSYPSPGVIDKSSLLQTVDDALYEAKRTGKNKTIGLKEAKYFSDTEN